MKEKIKFSPFDELDKSCKQKLEDFKRDAEFGIFTDDDGFGLYATDTEVSNREIEFWDFDEDNYNVPEWATHVVWYNK